MENFGNRPAENSRQYRESFVGAIFDIKKNACETGIFLTDSDISQSIGISIDVFNQYYHEDTAPEEIFTLLRSHYQNFLRVKTIISTQTEEFEDPENEA